MIIGIAYAVTNRIGKVGWLVDRACFVVFLMSVFKRVCVCILRLCLA